MVVPFIFGIAIQHHCNHPVWFNWMLAIGAILFQFIFSRFSLRVRFSNYTWQGICFSLLFVALGGIITFEKNPYAKREQVSPYLNKNIVYVVRLLEPLQEKKSTWKSLAHVESITVDQETSFPQTNMLLYFSKRSKIPEAGYGDRILIIKPPEWIENNPALNGIDYVKFCALKNIHLQAFLQQGDYLVTDLREVNSIQSFIFKLQSWVVDHLSECIPGDSERGLALALLIGYKNDLDRSLLQAYSNTGVVHVIAISGLHLGIIYGILRLFCMPMRRNKAGKWISPLIIISGLWLFSLLAGASPSVLRSAVMFSFIVAGQSFSRNGSMLNNLFASAFFLLCYEPFWLWDLGFILSYSALLSIIIFEKSIYSMLYFKSRVVDMVWKMNSVTIAAQILTMPVLLFNFQQFPALFLFTNFVAIPLSSIILIGEIILCCISFSHIISGWLGSLLSLLINLMNSVIVAVDKLPFASITGLDINIMHLVLLYVLIAVASRFFIFRHLK